MQGWVSLHRKLMTSDIFQNEKLLKVFIYCLLKASHKEHSQKVGKQTVQLMPGQFIFGRRKAAFELNMKESTVRDYMKVLKDEATISIDPTNKYSVITIVNWDFYQDKEEKNDSKYASKMTSKGQQNDTNNNVYNGNKSIKPSCRKNKFYDKGSTEYQLASRLFERIKENNPEAREPNLQKWADDVRLMIERDKRTEKQIAYLIDWTQQDSFWKGNILSPGKLRKQFDQLAIRIKERNNGSLKGNKPRRLIATEKPDHVEDPVFTEYKQKKLDEMLNELYKEE